MGRVSGVAGKRESRQSDYPEIEYLDSWAFSPSHLERDGEVCGGGNQISTAGVRASGEGFQTETPQKDEGEKGGSNMNVWYRFFTPKPTYFDRVTGIVEQLVDLECTLRDDEAAAHDKLHEIEAARREIAVRVRRA